MLYLSLRIGFACSRITACGFAVAMTFRVPPVVPLAEEAVDALEAADDEELPQAVRPSVSTAEVIILVSFFIFFLPCVFISAYQYV